MYRAILYKFVLALTIALVVLDSISLAFDGDETDHTGCPKGNFYGSKEGKKLNPTCNTNTNQCLTPGLQL